MAKMTLLSIVQEILNDMNSDFVNGINDTEEAESVSLIVQSTYRAMMSNRNWPHTAKIFTLTASGDNNFPTYMTLGDDVKELISVNYDKIKTGQTKFDYQSVNWKESDDFLRYINLRDSTDTNVLTVNDPSGVKLLIATNAAPSYYTSFDDNTLIFDSYDSVVDTTLQSSKTQAKAYFIPTFTLSDTFIPDLPDEAFSALVEEAKAKATAKIGEKEDPFAVREADRQGRWLSRKAWRVSPSEIYPNNYGRGGSRAPRDTTFKRG